MKKAAILSFILSIVLVFSTSCGVFDFLSKSKTFQQDEMSITLSSVFEETSVENYTSAYDSPDIAVLTVREDFSLFEGIDLTLNQYAELVISTNGRSCYVIEENGLTYFIYEETVNSTNYMYFVSVYKSDSAYWIIQFACESEKYDELKDAIIKYAKSVTFDSSAESVSNVAV